MSVTIPASLHASMVNRFQHEYEDEFGKLDSVVEYSRNDLIDKYARDILFWKARVPEIRSDKRPDIRTICAHAIATNAITNMEKLSKERGIHEEVQLKISISSTR